MRKGDHFQAAGVLEKTTWGQSDNLFIRNNGL